MSLESQIADLVSATNALTNSVNVSKTTLDQKVASASTSASTATTKANEAVTKAGEAAGSAASALAIYGNTTAMQTAVAQAAAQASLAAGHAANASSVVQQDLSGVTAAALHRSPNAVTAMFVYDTSKDSDGGAWTEKCQHTSWYNETLSGKWLGAKASESDARNHNEILGSELVANGNFDSGITGWTPYGIPTSDLTWENNNSLKILPSVLGWNKGVYTTIDVVPGSTLKFTRSVTSSGNIEPEFNIGSGPDSYVYVRNIGNGGYFTVPAGVTKLWLNQNTKSNSAGSYIVLDNVSVKVQIARTTASGDYFQLTTDGKFYKLNDTSGTTEVFRGNKRDFPRLAGIVAEASNGPNSVVTIYDLTEPGRPMWMAFKRGITSVYGDWGILSIHPNNERAVSCVAAFNGVLVVGSNMPGYTPAQTSPEYGMVQINFPKDGARNHKGDGGASYLGNIGTRNATQKYGVKETSAAIAHSWVNAVAMTVLPDAPVDPVTGLKVPTIWVATNGGVSRIAHNGTVSNSAPLGWPDGVLRLKIIGKYIARYGHSDASYTYFQIQPIDVVSTAWTTIGPIAPGHTSYSGVYTASGKNTYGGYGDRVFFVKEKPDNTSKGIQAFIRNTFNTGHQIGDIRRTYLSDIEAGEAAPLLVDTQYENFTMSNSWNDRNIRNQSKIIAGRLYKFVIDVNTLFQPFQFYYPRAGLYTVITINKTGQTVVYAYAPVNDGFDYTIHDGIGGNVINSLKVYGVDYMTDRSYKQAKLTQSEGSLTRTPVATGAQLVAYSGFSS